MIIRIMICDQESVWNNQIIIRNVPTQWQIKSNQIKTKSLFDNDEISENGRNIYEWNKSINQHSKSISIELPQTNDYTSHQVARQIEGLEYLNTINIHYSVILSNVTERVL